MRVNGTAGGLLTLFASLAVLLYPACASPSGFFVNEQGAKAVGMGGAFVAQADDPSAIFHNPAGIVQLPGTQVSAGVSSILPGTTFNSDGNPVMGSPPGQTGHMKDHLGIIPGAYVTRKLSENISVGLGTFSHFGLQTDWPRDFEGRFSVGGLLTSAKTLTITPVIAVKPIASLSLGFGPYWQYLDVDLRNVVLVAPPSPPLSPERNAQSTAVSKLTGTDWDMGWNAGILWRPVDAWSFGVSYLSQIKHDIHGGKQRLTRMTDGSVVLVQRASSRVTFPAIVRFGAAWNCNPWTIEVDAQWTEWQSYRTLRVDLANGTSIASPRNWHNTWTLRFGGQYKVNRRIDVRAGFAWDESPIPRSTVDPMLPSGNRTIYCLGLGVHLDPVTLDLAYNYVDDSDRRWNNSGGDVKAGTTTLTRVTGTFTDSSGHVGAVSVTYKF
ncbi:MAG: putative outer membrane protein precursor [Syntrophorhabdaceae bacterium PtaU1.Bin034]|jgi:long-chain fatty acid transport protein|nr:MAG: putative outer membrane protein precursor [Syntrophorhabdaceae bacterium PtaU1.Bin034]